MIEYLEDNAYDIIQEDVIRYLGKYLDKEINDIVIVGAYHGTEIPEILYHYPKCNILAFEAYKPNFDTLVRTFKTRSNVKCYNVAISDKKGIEIFYELKDIGNGSLLRTEYPEKLVDIIKVPTDRLDSYVNENIDLLWVDVQGKELDVLKGFDITKAKALYLEVSKGTTKTYKGTCLLSDLEKYVKNTHFLHSIGLDKTNGTGNAFWLRNNNGT